MQLQFKMKKFFIVIWVCLCMANTVIGQTTIDTLYYDKDWKGCEKTFATYYRVYMLSTDSTLKKKFRDYYITGELRSEGEFISIDKNDDSKSIFDGEFISYYKSGKIEQKGMRINGKQEGEYIKYKEDGLILVHTYFKNDKLHGICTEFSEDGNLCMQIEYDNGTPLYDYYTLSNKDGYCSKVSLANEKPIYDTPSLNEKQIEYKNGEAWNYYNKNGIMLGIIYKQIRNYGKYYQIFIVVANNSMFPIEFIPEDISATLIDREGFEKDLKVYSVEEYMKRVRRQQNWSMAAVAINEGLSAANAGRSTSTTNTFYSGTSRSRGYASAYGSGGYAFGNYFGSSSYLGGSSSTTTTYNGAAAYQAQVIASERVASYSNILLSDRAIKEEGYLKRTTIHPGEIVSGYVNIGYKKGVFMTIKINIGGIIYIFPLDIKQYIE